MRAAADIVERRGARFIEAPFTGSKTGAEKGELVYYVAGDEMALREARPILEATSKQIIEIGEIGQATAIKVATNILTAASVQAAAEGLALVHNLGIPLEKFTAAMQGNASNSGTISMKLPKMIEGDFEPHFSIKHMLKDMQIASRLGLLNHLELSVATAARDRLLEQMQRGYGDEDFSAVIRKYFHKLGRPDETETALELFEQPTADESAAKLPPIETAGETAARNSETEPAGSNLTPSQTPGTESETTSSAKPAVKDETTVGSSAAVESRAGDGGAMPLRRGFFERLLRRSGEC
jgi:hypothetical protein